MEFLHLGNIPQSLQGVNARETCTSFWTRRRQAAAGDFCEAHLRGGTAFDKLFVR